MARAGVGRWHVDAAEEVRKMMGKLVAKVMTSRAGCLAGGATLMYLFDPDRGRSRRARMVQRAEATARKSVRGAARRTMGEERHMMGRLEGVMAEAKGGGRFKPESDVDLREHLRQVIRTMHLPGEAVNVDVNEGAVALRGQIQTSEDRDRIMEAVRGVAGVSRIEDFMHLPGAVPPNKAPVIGNT